MDRKKIITGLLLLFLLFASLTEGLALVHLKKAPESEQTTEFHLNTSVSSDCALSTSGNYQRIHSNLSYIESLIQQNYLYDVDTEQLETGIYKGLLDGLDDPYSEYYSPQEYENIVLKSRGAYSGIGAVLTQDPDTMRVTIAKVYEDSPAKEAGLVSGDSILEVDGIDIGQMELADVVMLIKGDENSQVEMKICKKGDTKSQDIVLIRKNIELQTLSYEMLEDKIGYIFISSWEAVTPTQYIEALTNLETCGMQKLIVDVRDNPGGVYSAVCQVLDYMAEDGNTLVYTLTKDGVKDEVRGMDGHSFHKPLVVLVNGNSASASEIFAGGIKDLKIGKIVGTRTYGKGIVQRFITLGDGAAIKITVSEYYLPSGVCIHKKGIEPDIEAKDHQLQKAIEVLEENECYSSKMKN